MDIDRVMTSAGPLVASTGNGELQRSTSMVAASRRGRRATGWLRHNAPVFLVVFLLFAWVFVYLIPYIFITVQPGQGGVHWKRFQDGTVTDRWYGEGLHIIAPWDRMYRYDLRYQQRSKEFEVLSSDGLSYIVEITVRFRLRPTTLGLLHKCVGSHYVETLIFPEVGSVARSVVAQLTPEELYVARRHDSETEILRGLDFDIGSCPATGAAALERHPDAGVAARAQTYLEADDVFIRRVVLPPRVAEAIEKKLVQQQEMLEYDYRLQKERKEAERKGIEANGIKVFQETVQQGPSPGLLQWRGIEATRDLAKSANSKIVIIGSPGNGGLPLILGNPDK